MKTKLANEPLKTVREQAQIAQRFESELSSLQHLNDRIEKQLEKTIKKCSDRKTCIRKLYALVEEKEKEVEELQSELERASQQ